MTRFLSLLSLLGLIISASGCCHHLCGGGCPPPPPCGPCGSIYGGAPGYSQAYVQPAYATASVPVTGYMTAAAPGCDCGPVLNPY